MLNNNKMDIGANPCNTEEKRMIQHHLYDKWVLWAHLPHDTDWSLKSYKQIMEISAVENILTLYHHLPEILIKNCMLFLNAKRGYTNLGR